MTWTIEDTAHSPALESVFALGNGYLGVRGAPEEGAPAYDAGTVLNGFYETWPIDYPEDAYGLARTGQTIVAPPDGSIVRLFADGEPLDVTTAQVRRTLDMRPASCTARSSSKRAAGARLRVRSRRLVSLARRNLVAIDYELTVLSGAAHVVLSSDCGCTRRAVAGRRPAPPQGLCRAPARCGGGRDARPARRADAGDPALRVDARVRDAQRLRRRHLGRDRRRRRRARLADAALETDRSLRLRKYVAYHWTADAAPGHMAARAHRTLDRAEREGYDAVERAHSEESRRSGRAATLRCTARRRYSAPCASTSSS